MRIRWSRRGPFGALFLGLCLVLILASDRGVISGDGVARWEALQALMEEGRLTRQAYSLLQPIAAVPLYALGDASFRWTAKKPPGSAGYQQARLKHIMRFVKRFNKFIAFFVLLWFFFVLRRHFGFGEREAALASVFLLFGSMLLPQAKDFYSECLWTLTSALALTGLSAREGGAGWLFALPLAASIPLNPVLALAFAAVVPCAALAAGSPGRALRSRALWVGGGALALGVLLTLLENAARRGGAFASGYTGGGLSLLSQFSTPLLLGLAGQLLSPARGIVFFAPTFFLGFALWRRREELPGAARRFVGLSLVYAFVLMLVYAKWIAWHGAGGWGPRYLLPLSVFGAVYFALWVRMRWRALGGPGRAAAALVGAASVAGYHIGATVNDIHLKACFARLADDEPCFWDLRNFLFSSLVRPGDWAVMLTHRSLPVLAAGVLLFLFLLYRLPAPPAGERAG